MNDIPESEQQKKNELNTFLFLTIFLAPIVSIAIVGGLGFGIWIYQMVMGPPGV